MKNSILQIVATPSPVYAIYNIAEAGHPKSIDDLLFRSCPALALIDDGSGGRRVVGLTVETDGLEVPEGRGFLGYADSKEEGAFIFLPKGAAI